MVVSNQLEETKMLPRSADAEALALGSAIAFKDAFIILLGKSLKPDDFYDSRHQSIYEAIQNLHRAARPVDMITVMEQLRLDGNLNRAGGPAYLAELSNRLGSSTNTEYHCDIVKRYSARRKVIDLGNTMMNEGYKDDREIKELFEVATEKLYEIVAGSQIKKSRSIADVARQRLAEMDALKGRGSSLLGLSTGHTDIDAMFSGLQKTNLMILAARPGMGKTSLVLCWALNMSIEQGIPGAFFSLEMSDLQLLDKMVSVDTGIPMHKIRDPDLRDESYNESNRIVRSAEKISDAPFYIDDTPGLTADELRSKGMELKLKHNIQYIVVDYLQLMSGSSTKRSQNREQEVSEISRKLKGVAKELDIPVIALSQLSRAVETRGGDKRPQLSDLRESGSLEQDADMVCFIYRPEYYDINEDQEGQSTEGRAIVITAKNRHGALGDVWLHFEKRTTKFSDFNEDVSFDIADARPSTDGEDLPF